MKGSWEPDFFVADWRVRPALGQLERGDVAVSVEARSLQVLACLARHAPNVVSKQRLIREVWGEAFVSDEVLSHAIWELRKAFGDEARSPRFIQTIAKKGYRLLAEASYRAAPEPLAAGCRIGYYEILEPIGGGAMGEVYKARDQRLGRVVALKFLPADLTRDPSARQRFLREAQALARLDHPNVATIYGTGETEGDRMFLALAFYEEQTLKQKLEKGQLRLDEALGIARQIARGLAAAHHWQIVHRDIKPANVMVLPDGTVKLLDFGLAKLAGATTLTRLGTSPGTPAYKSPEQTRGEKVDSRSDLWALGVVLYEMVTGRLPFGGEYEQAVIYSILNEPPRPLASGAFPSQLSKVIGRALAKNPAERYQTAEEFESDLAPMPPESSGEIRRRIFQALRPSRRAVWLAVALALVFGGVVSTWWWREHRWDYSPEVKRLVKQGDDLERRRDTQRVFAASELRAAGRYDEAEAVIRKVLEHDPDHPTANQILGEIYLAGRRNLAALPLFQKVFEATHDSRAANGLGLAYLNLERMPEAIKIFNEAYRLQPDPITARNLAECYEKVGQKGEAQRWYALALAGFDRLLIRGGLRTTYLLYVRSFCAAKLGRIDEAFGNIQEAMRLEQKQLLTSLDFPRLPSLPSITESAKLGRINEALGRFKPDQRHFLFRMAQIHAIAGHRDAVYTYAVQAIQAGYPREEFREDFVFRPFQNDPKFRAIVDRAVR
jgi:serine/threonine protein kinase